MSMIHLLIHAVHLLATIAKSCAEVVQFGCGGVMRLVASGIEPVKCVTP
jgi:hypothetical protein